MSITRPHGATRPAAIRMAAIALRACERLLTGVVAVAGLGALIGGIPWGLWHYVGWPLPDHVPTWDEVQATLLSPMRTQLLPDVLACVTWPVWARFTLDVALSIPDTVRGIPRPTGPMRTVAGALVGVVVFAVLGNRGAPAQAVPSAVPAAHFIPPVATVELAEQPSAQISPPGTAIVRPPADGIYDSLWRIAERELGNGNRWPTIWQLNKGKTQVDGRVFTNPNLIRPGWILMLPDAPHPPAPPPHHGPERDGDTPAPEPGVPTSPPATTNPPATADSTPAESAPSATAEPNPAPEPDTGITVSTGAFVGLGLAALITIALITVRLWRRRTYQPGSGDREEPTIAPIVRALRIAHDATPPRVHQPEVVQLDPAGTSQDVAVRERARATADSVLPAGDDTIVGLRDGHAVALDLARTRGLGLVGPGAIAATRALLANLLAQGQRSQAGQPTVVVPAADVALLIGEDAAVHHPAARLQVVDDLDAALGVIEAELLARTRRRLDAADEQQGALVLVATPIPHTDRRLQAVLDNGSTLGIASILIGQWRSGGTARIRADGTISATSPNIADALTGTRLFTLPGGDTSDLLDLLGTAEEITVEQDGAQHGHTPLPDARSREPIGERPASVPARAGTAAGSSDEPRGEVATSDRQHQEVEQQAASAPLELTVLGRMHLHHRGSAEDSEDLIEVVAPKQREILVYLALHPNGVRRDVLTATIWPEAPASRPANSFHATLSQLRKAIRKATRGAVTDLAINRDGHCRLDHAVVDVDLWHLRRALDAYRHDPRSPQQRNAVHEALRLYTGDLADGLTAEWLDDPRDVLRRDVLDAISAVAHDIAEDDPHQHLALLERARGLDPYNEATYRAIARAQARLGQHDAVPRTLALLTTALAAIDQRPAPETIALCESIQKSDDLATK